MSRTWVGILCFWFICFSSTGYADNARLITYFVPLPPLISKDGTEGALVEVLDEIGKRASVRIDKRHLTIPRAVRKIDRGERVSLFPVLGSSASQLFTSKVLLSAPIGFRVSQIYKRQSASFAINSLHTQIFVTAPTALLPTPLNKDRSITSLKTHSLESALNILVHGRADLLINDITLTNHAIQQAGIHTLERMENGPTYIQPAHIAFSNTTNSRIRSRINIAILSMVADGSLKRLLPHNFVEDYMAFQSDQVSLD